jgi:hypothetical protein
MAQVKLRVLAHDQGRFVMRQMVGPPLILSRVLAAIAYAPAINNGFIADESPLAMVGRDRVFFTIPAPCNTFFTHV